VGALLLSRFGADDALLAILSVALVNVVLFAVLVRAARRRSFA